MNNNKKIIIVYLYPLIFRKFHWAQNEFNYYKEFSDIEVHELYKIEYPHITKIEKLNFREIKYIKNFSSFKEWKLYFINLISFAKKKNKKILVIKPRAISFFGLRLSFFLKKNKIDYIIFSTPAIPDYKTEVLNINYILKITFKVFNFIKFPTYSFTILKNVFIKKIEIYLNLKPLAIFASGKKWINYLKKEFKNVKIFPIHSLDYSKFILNDHKIQKLVKKKIEYAVFIDFSDLGKESLSDANILKKNIRWINNEKEWYSSLNIFFNKLEELFKLKIVVALHPKQEITKLSRNNYRNRLLFYNKTQDLVKYSKFIITMGSTAVSYAVIYKKPIVYIYSDESKKDYSTHKYHNFLKNFLDSKRLNIKNININKKDVINYNVNKKKYFLYKKNYLSCVNNNLPNYKIFYNNFFKQYLK